MITLLIIIILIENVPANGRSQPCFRLRNSD